MRSVRLPHGAALVAATLVFSLAASGATAQFTTISTGNILENAPIFTQSAVVHDRGGASLGGHFLWVLVDEEEIFGGFADQLDVTAWQADFGGSFGVTDRITLGASVPYLSFSTEAEGFGEDEISGLGDMNIFGRAQLWRSDDDRTKLAALASVTLPTADDEFFVGLVAFIPEESLEDVEVDRSPDFSIGGAISHGAARAALHASVEYTLGGDLEVAGQDFGSTDVLSLSGAGVFRAGEHVRLTGEVLFESFQTEDELDDDEEDTETAIAGGVRYSPNPHFFLDGGVILPVTTDEVTAVLLLGATWVR